MMYRLMIVVLSLAVAACGGGGSGSGGGNIGISARVPNVVGQTQANATTAITNAGLHVGNVTSASSTVAVGNVIRQNPVGGTMAAPASNVDLVVSSGPAALVDAFPNLPNFDRPLFLAAVPTPDTRLVVVEQTGRIKVFDPAVATSTDVVIDVSPLITTIENEQGLIGFAFDPDFQNNHFIYVNYTRLGDGAIVVARYTWDGTNSVNLTTAKPIIQIPHPSAGNHNGGMLAFGHDGKLYIGTGDGGGGDDQFHNGQNVGSLLAKILRIDVHPQNAADPYDVPADNPFIAISGARPEIWAMGFRNPYRFSFDRTSGDLWLGDVGQNQFEEIDVVERGLNYGWPAFEGMHAYLNVPLAAGTTHAPPLAEYDHSVGDAIIGGYVYRGSRFASLSGRYVYADFGFGTIWAIDSDGTNNAPVTTDGNPTSFGEDNNGELYVVDRAGSIFHLTGQ